MLENIDGYQDKYSIDKDNGTVIKNDTGYPLKLIPAKDDSCVTCLLKDDLSGKYVRKTLIELIIGKPTSDSMFPITKDNNYENMSVDNILYGDTYTKFYYKYCHNTEEGFNKYLRNRVCTLSNDITEAVNDGLVVVKSIQNANGYLIDTNGEIFSLMYSRMFTRKVNDHGYLTATVILDNKKLKTYNLNRLLGETFIPNLDKEKDSVVTIESRPRDNVDITNLMWSTRSAYSKKYHKEHPEHYTKYLRPSKKNFRSVSIDGVKFRTIADSSVHMHNLLKLDGVTRRVTTIANDIRFIIRNSLYQKSIYGEYDIKEIEHDFALAITDT